MLQFTPQQQLLFTPTQHHYLQTILNISNPSPRPALFKVKASKPSLFQVAPSVGLIMPKQSIRIQIVSRFPNTPQLVHDVSYQNKFMIQYALFERVPATIQEGLQLITEDNRQQKKLFSAIENVKDNNTPQSYSEISNKYSYKSGFYDRNDSQQLYGPKNRVQKYQQMKENQKLQHLSKEIDRLQIEKSHLITSQKPKTHRNLFRLLLVFVICILIGFFVGKSSISYRQKTAKKQKEYRWFGLERYWLKQQEAKPEQWTFWK